MMYVLEVVIDGKSTKHQLVAMPSNVIVRFYQLEQTETLTLLAEKVLK